MTRPSINPVGNSARPALPTATVTEIPDAPATLGDYGAVVWDQVWKAGGSAYNSASDSFVITRYCDLQERRRDLTRLVNAEGFLSTGSQGQSIMHPAVRALDSTEKELRALEDRLGLNPESRARLGLAAVQAEDALEAFRRKLGG